MSGSELAVYMGCHRTWVSHMEAGRNSPSLEMLHRMAVAFGVDEMDLLTFPDAHIRHHVVDLTRKASMGLMKQIAAMLEEEARGGKAKAEAGKEASALPMRRRLRSS